MQNVPKSTTELNILYKISVKYKKTFGNDKISLPFALLKALGGEFMKLRLAGTVNDSIVDGPGLRFTIFVQGCPHKCFGCHNAHTHDFSGGSDSTTEELLQKIISNPLLDGVTFSGGEPFCQAEPLYVLGKELKNKGYNIITYTGYTFEYLLNNSNIENFYKELLSVTDFLIDGRFEADKMSLELKFKGSSNQRILDCKKSIETESPIVIEL